MFVIGSCLFSIHCEDRFFKIGLQEIFKDICSSVKLPVNNGIPFELELADYFVVDIIVLSSKAIYEKIPEQILKKKKNHAAIIFCSDSMTHILTGITGYDLVSCIPMDVKLEKLAQIFCVLVFGTEGAKKSLFTKTGLAPLTCNEMRVSSLLSKGLNQHDISQFTGINPKTVSLHLRSAMTKFKVKTLLEYRVKLSHIDTLDGFN
ncbi:helix-turn-helix domain-containing protein [Rahnella sp. PAMC25617]|uniref:helix-turn-helix domain-containing protein n=1 Tax=Rahnella TaxID=34037 RepID=UPI000DEBD5AA|nr:MULTISPECIES: helix-turn-helix transcriptional regulator [Rahnella]RBQ35612.1 hypothetical protein C2125_02650 [Rahnella aquatilis]RYJ11915.1 hypothetical protein C5Y41_20610 [Rahnella variigena]